MTMMESERQPIIGSSRQPGLPHSLANDVIERVNEGMSVVDATGHRLGKVATLSMGDPEADTTQGNEPRDPGLLGDLAMALTGDGMEPDVPEPKRSQLVRLGYVAIDGGFGAPRRYANADQLAEVSGDTLTLRVSRDQLITKDADDA